MRRKIDALLEEQVRPSLAAHGGNVEVVDVDNNQVFLKLSGGCHGCSSSNVTLKQGIEKIIKQNSLMDFDQAKLLPTKSIIRSNI